VRILRLSSLILLLLCFNLNAQEVIVSFEKKDLPVLNEELRKLKEDVTEATLEVPIGGFIMWLTDTAPDNWLLCYGQAISRTTYEDLFEVIGTTFGVGDGSTTFALPDLRGRIPLGQDDMGGSSADRVTDAQADSIGGASGVEEVTLTSAQSGLPAHDHDIRASSGSGGNEVSRTSSEGSDITDTTAIANNTAADAASAHTNVQPFITVNYIIKYK